MTKFLCRKISTLSLFLFLFGSALTAQNFQLVLDPINPFQKQSLFNLSVINSSGYSGQINLKATLKNRRGKVLMTQEVNETITANGSKSIRGQRENINTRFADSDFGQLYNSNSQLPPLNYVLCVEVIAVGELKTTSQECVDYQASDFLNLVTIYPPDEEIIYDPRPQFNWLDLNLGANYSYQFKLVELKENQNKNVALRRNNPIVINEKIGSNQLQFPSDAILLKNNAKYAWQLAISYKGELLSRSEPTVFTYKDEIEYMSFPKKLAYVDITQLGNGAALYAVGEFKFIYPSSGESIITAKVYNANKKKKDEQALIANDFTAQSGMNRFEFDLSDQVYLKHLKYYEIVFFDSFQNRTFNIEVQFINPDYIK
ncbi:MAG: hypothetical protein ACI9DK_002494 [Vicingaceae bacterium]|jgi:hypothetical protein